MLDRLRSPKARQQLLILALAGAAVVLAVLWWRSRQTSTQSSSTTQSTIQPSGNGVNTQWSGSVPSGGWGGATQESSYNNSAPSHGMHHINYGGAAIPALGN